MATTIEEAVRAWLISDPGVEPLIQDPSAAGQAAIAAGSGGYQVWKESIPEEATIGAGSCAIALKVDSDSRLRALDAVVGDLDARVILTLESDDEELLGTLFQAIRGSPNNKKLDGLTASRLGNGSTWVWCQYCEVEDRPDDFVPSPHAKDAGTFTDHLALRIAYYSAG